MSQGFIKAIDDGIIGMFLDKAVHSGLGIPFLVGKAAQATGALIDGAAKVFDTVTSSTVAGIGFTASIFGKDSPAIEAPVKQQAVEIASPSPANKFEVPMCELGSFSPSALPTCSRGGAGIGM